jgi:hypothetical protein
LNFTKLLAHFGIDAAAIAKKVKSLGVMQA